MSAMRMFSLMINNTRQCHSISLSILKLGTTFLPSLYLKMSSCIISASDNYVTYTAFVFIYCLRYLTFDIHLHICNFLNTLPLDPWANVTFHLFWTLLEPSKCRDQSIHHYLQCDHNHYRVSTLVYQS